MPIQLDEEELHRLVDELPEREKIRLFRYLSSRNNRFPSTEEDENAPEGTEMGERVPEETEIERLPLHLTLTPEEFRAALDRLSYSTGCPPLSDEDISRETIYD